jgi:CDP-diacylglycerol--serine O-phosphatidyltransferase
MDLKKTLFILPNLLTAASLLCGMLAIIRCMAPSMTEDDIFRASLLLFYAFLFDLFDGRVARMTRTQSKFGIEFDSLADLVSFGVAPAAIAYRFAFEQSGVVGAAVCFVYVLGGAIRLARFNVISHGPKKDPGKPDKYMLGLPIPMAAAFVLALVVATRAMGGWPWLTQQGFTVKGIGYPMMTAVMPILAVLMVSSVRFRSFKDLRISPFTITLLAVVIATSGLLWLWFSPSYILISLLLMYVGMGFIEAIASWPRRRRERRERPGE